MSIEDDYQRLRRRQEAGELLRPAQHPEEGGTSELVLWQPSVNPSPNFGVGKFYRGRRLLVSGDEVEGGRASITKIGADDDPKSYLLVEQRSGSSPPHTPHIADYVSDRWVSSQHGPATSPKDCEGMFANVGINVTSRLALSDKYGTILSNFSAPGGEYYWYWCRTISMSAFATCENGSLKPFDTVTADIPVRYELTHSTSGTPAKCILQLRAFYFFDAFHSVGVSLPNFPFGLAWFIWPDDAEPVDPDHDPGTCYPEANGRPTRELLTCFSLDASIGLSVGVSGNTIGSGFLFNTSVSPVRLFRYNDSTLDLSETDAPLNLSFSFENLPLVYDPSDVITITGPA